MGVYIYIYYPPYIILYPHQLDIWSLGPPKLDQKTRPVQEGKGDMLAYYEALKEEFDGDLTQIAAARIENNPRHGKNWVILLQQQDVVAIGWLCSATS